MITERTQRWRDPRCRWIPNATFAKLRNPVLFALRQKITPLNCPQRLSVRKRRAFAWSKWREQVPAALVYPPALILPRKFFEKQTIGVTKE